MQNKLIALAVAGLMAAPAAMASDVTTYGKIRLSVDVNSNNADTATTGDPATTASDSAVSVSSHASRIGFKGSEDLDNGMKAIWQIESQIEIDDGSGFSSKLRNTFGGITGGFGTVVLGTHDTPYKMAAKKVEVMSDTVADYGKVIHDPRAPNVLAYLSPDFNGFSFAAAYIPSVSNDDLQQTEAENEQMGTSVSLTYKTGDLMVAVANEVLSSTVDGAFDADNDSTYTKIGGTYALGMTTLGLVYESADDDGGDDAQDTIYASVKHQMDKTGIHAAYGQIGESESDAEDGGAFMALGVTQKLAKNTEVYAIYAGMSNDDNGTNSLKTVKYGEMGEGVSSFSLGINHKF